ncbi:MAG: DUF4861 family protein [Verrucomicrobia bacterium]|nr:DUF4861 family protein [Verrucomicrobiota bacterium]
MKTAAIASLLATAAHAAPLKVEAVNPLQAARASETLELTAAHLAPLGAKNLNLVHVKDAAGAEILCQAVDTDGDPLRLPDIVIFQSDFGPGETKVFTLSVGEKNVYRKDQFKAFGRFARERFDDFAWENDRIAHRTYGRGLETWEGEPLCSSTIDIWSKRTEKMVVNDWYLADDYHADRGDGADFYSAGPSRGCGGSGLWAGDRLWVSRNFTGSNVLANGPIRVMFDLTYEPYDVNGASVAETKRVTLDGGRQFDRYDIRYKVYAKPGQSVSLTPAIGLKKSGGEVVADHLGEGWLAKWEPMEKKAGQQGLAVIVENGVAAKSASDKLNHLVIRDIGSERTVTWWAGFCWDKAGHFTTASAWNDHVSAFSKALAAPIRIAVTAGP